MSKETKEIMVVDFKKDYPVLFSQVNIGEAMRSNFEGQDIFPRDLFFQVTVPGSGGTEWDMIDEKGEVYQTKEITGIVLGIGYFRAYHEGEFGVGDKIPTCAAEDGENGVGVPGGKCAACALNEFGTAKNQKAKACKEYKPLYILVPGIARPIAIRVSSGSFTALKNFNVDLTMAGLLRHRVMTKFTLKKVKGTPDFSMVVFTVLKPVNDPAVIAAIESYQTNISPFFKPIKSNDGGTETKISVVDPVVEHTATPESAPVAEVQTQAQAPVAEVQAQAQEQAPAADSEYVEDLEAALQKAS